MTCAPCDAIQQFAANVFLTLDRGFNVLLMGSANETFSQRAARAELAGNRVGAFICRILGWFNTDHCAWSLSPGTIGGEIWHWSPPMTTADEEMPVQEPVTTVHQDDADAELHMLVEAGKISINQARRARRLTPF